MRLLLALILTSTITLSFSQSIWEPILESKIEVSDYEREIIPTEYHTFSLDISELTYQLSLAPMEDLRDSKQE